MDTTEYNHIKTLKEAKQIIAQQDLIIGKQYRELLDYQDRQIRLNECNSKRKREAGYPQSVSFDVVWKEILEKTRSF